MQLKDDNMFGAYLSELRKENGYTQKEFGKIFHLSESSIAHYEQGRAFPDISIIIQIANYFDVNIDYLFGRCHCKLKYNELEKPFICNMTYSDLVNAISDLPKDKKKYLYDTILMLKDKKH